MNNKLKKMPLTNIQSNINVWDYIHQKFHCCLLLTTKLVNRAHLAQGCNAVTNTFVTYNKVHGICGVFLSTLDLWNTETILGPLNWYSSTGTTRLWLPYDGMYSGSFFRFEDLLVLLKDPSFFAHYQNIWGKVLKNGLSKICGRQPLKILKWDSYLKRLEKLSN